MNTKKGLWLSILFSYTFGFSPLVPLNLFRPIQLCLNLFASVRFELFNNWCRVNDCGQKAWQKQEKRRKKQQMDTVRNPDSHDDVWEQANRRASIWLIRNGRKMDNQYTILSSLLIHHKNHIHWLLADTASWFSFVCSLPCRIISLLLFLESFKQCCCLASICFA